jgi:hypothetical protein
MSVNLLLFLFVTRWEQRENKYYACGWKFDFLDCKLQSIKIFTSGKLIKFYVEIKDFLVELWSFLNNGPRVS